MTSDNHYYFDPEPIIILLPFNKMNNQYCPLEKRSTMPYFILNLCLLVSSNKILFFQVFTKKGIKALKNRKKNLILHSCIKWLDYTSKIKVNHSIVNLIIIFNTVAISIHVMPV